jgi:hypothetical protein
MRNTLLLLAVAGFAATSLNVSAQIKAQGYDTPSYVQFSAPRYEVSETETNAVVTLVRSGDFRKTASIDYTTQEGTAADGVDFEACGGTVVFAAGQSFRTITIPILRSPAPVTKTFQVQMTEGDFNTVVTTPSAEVEIKPQPPGLRIAAKKAALVVSWPDSGAKFVLEGQVDGQWSAVNAPPVLADGNWTVTLTPGAPVILFRLRLDSETPQ